MTPYPIIECNNSQLYLDVPIENIPPTIPTGNRESKIRPQAIDNNSFLNSSLFPPRYGPENTLTTVSSWPYASITGISHTY